MRFRIKLAPTTAAAGALPGAKISPAPRPRGLVFRPFAALANCSALASRNYAAFYCSRPRLIVSGRPAPPLRTRRCVSISGGPGVAIARERARGAGVNQGRPSRARGEPAPGQLRAAADYTTALGGLTLPQRDSRAHLRRGASGAQPPPQSTYIYIARLLKGRRRRPLCYAAAAAASSCHIFFRARPADVFSFRKEARGEKARRPRAPSPSLRFCLAREVYT